MVQKTLIFIAVFVLAIGMGFGIARLIAPPVAYQNGSFATPSISDVAVLTPSIVPGTPTGAPTDSVSPEASPTAPEPTTTNATRTRTTTSTVTARGSPTSDATALPTRTASATVEATSSATATTAAGFVEYTVQAEDSLETIAERFNTTVEAIIEFNPQITTQGVGVGDVIRIPVEGTPEANTP